MLHNQLKKWLLTRPCYVNKSQLLIMLMLLKKEKDIIVKYSDLAKGNDSPVLHKHNE